MVDPLLSRLALLALHPNSGQRIEYLASWLQADPSLREWVDRRLPGELPAEMPAAEVAAAIDVQLVTMLEDDGHIKCEVFDGSLAIEHLRLLLSIEQDFQARLSDAKLNAMRELAYGASHEINNPLANISTRAQTLLHTEGDPDRRKALATIHSQALRAYEMIATLMHFAKPPSLQISRVSLKQLIDDVCETLDAEIQEQGVSLVVHLPEDPLILEADPTHVTMAIRGLLRNSLDALEGQGTITIAVKVQPNLEAKDASVAIVVSDDGPGIPAALKEHAFEPFFSGREAGRGMGVGLSYCWRIAQLHGGDVSLLEAERGTVVEIVLPLKQ